MLTHTQTHTRTSTHKQSHAYTYIHTHTCTHTQTYTQTHKYTCTYKYICTHAHTLKHTHRSAHPNTHTNTHTHTQTHPLTQHKYTFLYLPSTLPSAEFTIDDLFASPEENHDTLTSPAYQAWTEAGTDNAKKLRVESILKQNDIPVLRCVNYKGRVIVSVQTWDLLRAICSIKIALKTNKTIAEAKEQEAWVYLQPKLASNNLHPDFRPYLVEFSGVPSTIDPTIRGTIVEKGYGARNMCLDIHNKPMVEFYNNGRTSVARCIIENLPEDNSRTPRRCIVYYDPENPRERGATTGVRLAKKDTVDKRPIPPGVDEYPTVRYIGTVSATQEKFTAWVQIAFGMEHNESVLIRHITPYEAEGVIIGVTIGFSPYLKTIYPELHAAIRSPPVSLQTLPLVSPIKFPCLQMIFPTRASNIKCYIATTAEKICSTHRLPLYACECGNPAKAPTFMEQLGARGASSSSPAMRMASMSIGKGEGSSSATAGTGGKRPRTQGDMA